MLRIIFAMCGLVLLLQAAIDAGQLAKNRGQKTQANKGAPAKGRGINLGRASGGLGQENRPLPPPSNGWIVIMQRFNFSLVFNRNWTEYKNGFGELQKEFWLGNDAIHFLSSGAPHKLRVEILAGETLFYADYDSFSIDSEDNKYQLHVSGYSGNAGDSLTNKTQGYPTHRYHDGVNFSTPDTSTTVCANLFKAGWWFTNCFESCLTCKLDNGYGLWITLLSSPYPTSVRMRIMRK